MGSPGKFQLAVTPRAVVVQTSQLWMSNTMREKSEPRITDRGTAVGTVRLALRNGLLLRRRLPRATETLVFFVNLYCFLNLLFLVVFVS
jgi:hypothetical protein